MVQGSAAEWALAWLGHIRQGLHDAGLDAQLVFFLHDEVMVHTPQEHADGVVDAVREAGRAAGELLFRGFPVQFPLDVAVVRSYDEAG